MKNTLLFLLLLTFSSQAQEFNYDRNWGTYFGDERFYLQDSKVDAQGNLYIVGFYRNDEGVVPPVFPTENAHQPFYGGGVTDGFLVKFNNSGQLLWATYFGGNGTDVINGIDLDAANNIYLVGSTASTNQVATPNAAQPTLHGALDFFITRLSPDGVVQWSSYYGGDAEEGARPLEFFLSESRRVHISHDQSGHFYIAGYAFSEGMGTSNTFQPELQQSRQLIAKFNNNGNRIWCTYYSSNENFMTGLSATANALYVRGKTLECLPQQPYNTYYGSAGSFQPTPLNCSNTFLSKFDATGQRLWSTYYGQLNSSMSNSVKIHNDKVYFSGSGRGNITTPGVFQETAGNTGAMYLAQFSEQGTRDWGTSNGLQVASTSVGGTANVAIDGNGDIFLSGVTAFDANIATAAAFQEQLNGNWNGYICKFDNTGNKIWGTYYGGEGEEKDLYSHPYGDNFYVVGRTTSRTGMATANAYQTEFLVHGEPEPTNIFIGHFVPRPLATAAFSEKSFLVFPNPNDGHFTITLKETARGKSTVVIYTILGKKIFTQDIYDGKNAIMATGLSKGMYLAKITTEDQTHTEKLLIK